MSGHSVSVDAVTLGEEIISRGDVATPEIAEYTLGLADDALVLGQRLSWWVSRGPELEEDLALANISLDQIGHARSLLSYAGTATGQSEDDLAYFRDEPEFRNLWIVEQPNDDYAHTIVRGLFVAAYQQELYGRLQHGADRTLAAIAAKAVKETEYHLEHAAQWMLRFGGGTEESHRRGTRALEELWPYLDEMFRDEPIHDALPGIAVRPSDLHADVTATIEAVLHQAGFAIPVVAFTAKGGGRSGEHTEHLAFLLAEMQVLARQHPGATW